MPKPYRRQGQPRSSRNENTSRAYVGNCQQCQYGRLSMKLRLKYWGGQTWTATIFFHQSPFRTNSNFKITSVFEQLLFVIIDLFVITFDSAKHLSRGLAFMFFFLSFFLFFIFLFLFFAYFVLLGGIIFKEVPSRGTVCL